MRARGRPRGPPVPSNARCAAASPATSARSSSPAPTGAPAGASASNAARSAARSASPPAIVSGLTATSRGAAGAHRPVGHEGHAVAHRVGVPARHRAAAPARIARHEHRVGAAPREGVQARVDDLRGPAHALRRDGLQPLGGRLLAVPQRHEHREPQIAQQRVPERQALVPVERGQEAHAHAAATRVARNVAAALQQPALERGATLRRPPPAPARRAAGRARSPGPAPGRRPKSRGPARSGCPPRSGARPRTSPR